VLFIELLELPIQTGRAIQAELQLIAADVELDTELLGETFQSVHDHFFLVSEVSLLDSLTDVSHYRVQVIPQESLQLFSLL
jgi:hypothetical protein